MPATRAARSACRTAFNLLGPLTNPAGASRQIVGVPRPEFTELMARGLLLLGSERAWVVHGADGIDESRRPGTPRCPSATNGAVKTFYLHPVDFGLHKAPPERCREAMAANNAVIIRRVLDGAHGPARDVGCSMPARHLFVAGRVDSIREGMREAATAIDTGAARPRWPGSPT
ncbi:MAG: hypothetical protein QM736_17375 [Vicinamibacterales bacterium]